MELYRSKKLSLNVNRQQTLCNFYKPLLRGNSLLTDTWEGSQGVRLIEVSL